LYFNKELKKQYSGGTNMTKLHTTSSARRDKPYDIGFSEEWNFKEVNELGLTHNVVAGGKERIVPSEHDRLLIVTQGFASLSDTKQVIRDGNVIEIPANTSIQFQGQLKYYLISKK
jgi:hypothetical protein